MCRAHLGAVLSPVTMAAMATLELLMQEAARAGRLATRRPVLEVGAVGTTATDRVPLAELERTQPARQAAVAAPGAQAVGIPGDALPAQVPGATEVKAAAVWADQAAPRARVWGRPPPPLLAPCGPVAVVALGPQVPSEPLVVVVVAAVGACCPQWLQAA